MATRSQNARTAAEKKGPNPKRAKKLAQRKARHTRGDVENRRAARKATWAKEGGRSRKSTRASANRSRGDAALIRRAENAASSPGARARRAKARS
jgi:hypothetical protein